MPTEAEIRSAITDLVNERLNNRQLQLCEFDDSAILEQLGLDSLDMVELWIAAEDRFKICIDEEKARSAKTFGDLIALVS